MPPTHMSSWNLSRLLYWIIAFLAIGYLPLAFTYMWHFFGTNSPAWQTSLTAFSVSPDYAVGAGSVDAARKLDYAHSRVIMLVHTTLGSLALALAMFQFVTRLRVRYPVLHRWTGRVYMALMTVSIVGSIAFLLRNNAVRFWMGMAFDLQLWALAASTLLTGFVALWAIRKRDIVTHQAWMCMNIALMLTAPLLRVFWIWIGPLWYRADLLSNLGAGSIVLAILAPGGGAIAFMLTRRNGVRLPVPDLQVPSIRTLLAVAAAGALITVVCYNYLPADFPYELLGVHLVPFVGYLLICLGGHLRALARQDRTAAWQWKILFAGAALIPAFTNAGWMASQLILSPPNAYLVATMIAASGSILLSFAVVVDLSSRSARGPAAAQARVG